MFDARRVQVARVAVALALALALVVAFGALPAAAEEDWASWYGQPFHGRGMANGQVFDMYDATTTAANMFPMGTWLRVTSPANGKTVDVQVRDRGAFKWALDLSYAAFAALDDPKKMMIRIRYEVIPGPGKAAAAPEPAKPEPTKPASAEKPALQTETPKKEATKPTEYVIAAGDTLTGIARRFGLAAALLATWNGLDDPNRIRIGQKLRLSEPLGEPPSPSNRGESTRPSAGFHTVAPGDTVWSLASKYGTTPQRLADVNDLANPDGILIGQRLVVPEPATNAPAAPSQSPVQRTRRYTVQESDSLLAIALRFDTTVAALVRANDLTDVDLLSIGQVLAIP